MKRRIKEIIISVLILAIGSVTIRLFFVLKTPKLENVDIKQGVSVVEQMNKENANKRENEIRDIRDKYQAAEERKKIAEAISSGNYKYAFKDVLIAGDSMVEAIKEYGILSPSNVIAKVGAGTVFLQDNLDNIVKFNPRYLVLHFGENQIGTTAQAKGLTDKYSSLINTLKKRLPNTKIYVDGMFPVDPITYKRNSYLKNIDFYNKALKDMSDKCGVKYIDYTSLWKTFDKNYYDGDGMHPKFSYYTEQYLPYLAQEMELSVK